MIPDLRVCFVGESFVAGVGDPEHLGWVGRVAARSESSGQPLTAYNLGVRREASGALLARAEGECRPRLDPAGTPGVVVSFGVNDTSSEGGRTRVSGADSVANLATLLRKLSDARWPVLVVGPPPVVDREHTRRTFDLDAAFEELCRAAGVPYVSVVVGLDADEVWAHEVSAGDGSHPGAAGYRHMADLVWPAWRSWLDALGAGPAPAQRRMGDRFELRGRDDDAEA